MESRSQTRRHPATWEQNTGYNECVVALENLCTQLCEYDVLPAPEELTTIQELAKEINLEESTWNFLRHSNS
ncbi:MafI family immunity protein [Rhizobium leguminosarum]